MVSKMIALKKAAQKIVQEDPTISIYIGNERITSEESSNEITRRN
jgi:hypothetical protein